MSEVVIFDRWRVRRGTAANLTAVNEVPMEGELVLETDTGRFKFGDGATAWNDLDYAVRPGNAVTMEVAQAAHGLVVGNAVCKSGADWIVADRDAETTTAVGIVSEVEDADNFTITLSGVVTLTTADWDAVTGDTGGLTVGEYYCLSSTAGGLSSAEPSTGIVQWLLLSDSATRAIVQIGEPFEVGAGAEGVWTLVVKAADQARSSTTTVADDSELAIALEANSRYTIRLRAYVETAGSSGFKYSTAYSGTTTKVLSHRRATLNVGTASGTDNELTSTFNTLLTNSGLNGTAGAGQAAVEIDLILQTGTAGTFSLQWAQNSSSAAAASVLAGSYIEYLKVA